MHLAGRGTTWVWEAPGPPGAPALLLLHGWMATAALNWHTAMPALAQRYRVVAMDMRGHGRGIRPRRPFRMADCADDAEALCRQLGTGPVVAVGYSMGGAVAQIMWRRHRPAVGQMVLCATAGLFGSRLPLNPPLRAVAWSLAQGFRAVPGPARAELLRRALTGRSAATPMSEWAAVERGPSDLRCLIEAGLELGSWDGAAVLADVDVPTAVVKTTRDRVVAPWRQQAMADAIPGARVFPIDADHGACVDQPEEFVAALLAACDAVTTVAGTAGGPRPAATTSAPATDPRP